MSLVVQGGYRAECGRSNSWLRFLGGAAEGEMRGESGAAREITLGREGRGRAASYYALPGATHGALRQDKAVCARAAVRAKRWREI